MNGVDLCAKSACIVPSPARAVALRRKCACGAHTIGGGECNDCQRSRLLLRRSEGNPESSGFAPPIVHRVLEGSGQPLDGTTRSYMEPRLGQDLSRVRIHADPLSAASARAVHAAAYAVGDHIVFGAHRFNPSSSEGRALLAHELTHVGQQQGSGAVPRNIRIDQPRSAEESEAEKNESEFLRAPSGPAGDERTDGRAAHRHGHPGGAGRSGPLRLQPKLALYSDAEAKAFEWYFTQNDAKLFSYDRKTKPYEITMTTTKPSAMDDAFRVSIMKKFIDAKELLIIRGFKLDDKVTPHVLYKSGKEDKKGVAPTLRQMGSTALGAGGVTLPSPGLALAVDGSYSGPCTGVSGESWIFYSSATSLAHEFGHAFLLFSGTSWEHRKNIPKSAGVLDPGGQPYAGPVNDYIKDFVSEFYVEPPAIEPDALHFSPTAVRTWPEPPDNKFTFKGTYLEFIKKYPGATVHEEDVGTGKHKTKQLKICVPKAGEVCF